MKLMEIIITLTNQKITFNKSHHIFNKEHNFYDEDVFSTVKNSTLVLLKSDDI